MMEMGRWEMEIDEEEMMEVGVRRRKNLNRNEARPGRAQILVQKSTWGKFRFFFLDRLR